MIKLFQKIKSLFQSLNLKQKLARFHQDYIKMPLRLIFYPLQGYDEFKREKKGKDHVAWFYLVMMIVVQVVQYNANGFLVNKNNPREFNLFMTILLIVFPVFIAVIANWATTALMDGKGNMKEIFRVITYSFFPYVWLGLVATLVSNFITTDEIIFFQLFQTFGVVLMVYMMYFGLMGIHEYSQGKTIMMVLFTIVAIAIILFIILLFFSLIQQVSTFFKSVIDEFIMRFL